MRHSLPGNNFYKNLMTYKRKVTFSKYEDRSPNFSPNGKYLAYQSKKPQENGFDIWVMDVDGNNKFNITNDSFDNQSPKWAPDNATVFYASKVGEKWQIMSVDRNGKNKRILTRKGNE